MSRLAAVGFFLDVEPRHARPSAAGFEQAREHFDRRGFSRAVRPEKGKKLPLRHIQIEIFDGSQRTEVFGKAVGLDHGMG